MKNGHKTFGNEPVWLNNIMFGTQDVTYAYRLSILASGASKLQPMGRCITFEMRKFRNIAHNSFQNCSSFKQMMVSILRKMLLALIMVHGMEKK